jgi:hypothetical protein
MSETLVTQQTPFSGDVDPQLTCLRVQDQAMVDWLLEMKIRGQSVKVTNGWISRFFSQQHQLWETPENPTSDKNKQRQTLPLPLMCVTQTNIAPAPDRNVNCQVTQMGFNKSQSEGKIWAGSTAKVNNLYACNGTLVTFTGSTLPNPPVQPGSISVEFTIGSTTYTETDSSGTLTNTNGKLVYSLVEYDTGHVALTFDAGQAPANNTSIRVTYFPTASWEKFYAFQWPTPIDLEYQVDLWAKTGQDLQMMRTAILSRFEHHPKETFLQAQFPFYGRKLLPLEWISDNDTSDLESDEKERTLRRTMIFTLHGWILKKPVIKKTIQNLHVVFIDGLPEEAGYDWYLDNSHYNMSGDGSQILQIYENPSITPPNKVLLWISFDSGVLTDVGGN